MSEPSCSIRHVHRMENVYLALTREFNANRFRVVITSGQAVVLHRLAVMSKDGDWIVRGDPEALEHVLSVLEGHGARYRFGAPLDERWMAGGWSSHFEFRQDSLRVRTDFFSRPPRLTPSDLARLWKEQEGRDPPFVGTRDLVEIKKTNREKDYAVIGELARLMKDPGDQLLCSRSARELIDLARRHPDLVSKLAVRRPLLTIAREGRDKLERELDAEKRTLIHANEERLKKYQVAARRWSALWPTVQEEIHSLSLTKAHRIVVERAEAVLPFAM